MTPQLRQFLQRSQCVAGQPWVCCPDQAPASATPIRTPSPSKGKLPRAPDCGIESTDKIYGGENTKIDEYPWLVQIQYTKREFKCPAKLTGMMLLILQF